MVSACGFSRPGVTLWWMYSQSKAQQKKTEEQQKKPEKQAVSRPSESPERADHKVAMRNDDLTKIEGIGPKVAGVLNEAGITSFELLIQVGPGRSEERAQ